jgi:hypothetical protein
MALVRGLEPADQGIVALEQPASSHESEKSQEHYPPWGSLHVLRIIWRTPRQDYS